MTALGAVFFPAFGALLGWHVRPVITGYAGTPAAQRVCPAGPGPGYRAWRRWAGEHCGELDGPPRGSTEAAMAGTFTAAALWSPARPVLAAACWLACCAVPLAFIDASARRLPNPLTAAAFAGTVTFLLLGAAAADQWQDLGRALAGGGVLAGCYTALAAAGASGLGDAKLSASLGAVLAWAGWWPLFAGACAAFLLAAPYSAALLLSPGQAGRRRLPFGPFMVGGTFLTLALLGTGTR